MHIVSFGEDSHEILDHIFFEQKVKYHYVVIS